MGLETFALINDQNQVVNHIIVDKEGSDFEEVMAGQLEFWGCVRYVETTEEQPVIILDDSPEIWTTHTEDEGFVLPEGSIVPAIVLGMETDEVAPLPETVIINGRKYPKDSMLIKENFARRPEGYSLPEGEVEVSLNDAE